ncbi:MAG: cytochrome P450 [Archangium sp.]|nr:cytochrome P450 [Archangium sp.]
MTVGALTAEAWSSGEAARWLEARRTERGLVPLADGLVGVVSHAAAMEVLTDSRRFTSKFGTAPQRREPVGASLNLSDPPHSTRIRRSLEKPEFVASPRWASLAEELLAAKPRDLVADFAQPLALAVFGELFGIDDPQALAELGRLTRALPRAADAAAFRVADDALLEWLRAHQGRTGAFFEAGAELSTVDQLYLQRLLAQTGHESTAMAIALSLELILRDGLELPDEVCRGGGAGDHLHNTLRAIDELVRVTSPLIRFAREATEDTELGACGTRFVVFFPLVNRDPRVFVDPQRVDFARAPNPHVAFGAGSHACFGAGIARAVLGSALSAFARRARPKLISSAVLKSSVTRGLDALLVAWS